MQGQIGVKSSKGEGSTFWFTFRMKIARDFLSAKTKKTKLNQGSAKSLNVLLVDDNAINRKVAMFTLQKLGHRVESAVDGKEAVEKYTQGDFDVILMDVQMPVMDGYEATAAIRSLQEDPDRPQSRIVAMTANAEKGEMEKCIELGMDDFISKPFKSEDLIKKLKHPI